jgi:hypothetical protein
MDLTWLHQDATVPWKGHAGDPTDAGDLWSPSQLDTLGVVERVRPVQKPGIGDLDLPVRKSTWQTFNRPVSCDAADRDLGMLSSQWGQDFLGSGFFPLSCPNMEAQAHCSAKKKVTVPQPTAPEPPPATCLDFNYEDFVRREDKLLVKIREFMESPKHNPEKGSIPSERVQNCIKQKHKELYNFVVSTVYANQWHRFIRKHDDVFELIFSKDEGRSLPRIRLRNHENYERADRREEEERRRRECVILTCLKQYLEDHGGDIRVEDFRTEYQRWLSEDPGRIAACHAKWRRLDHPAYQEPPPVLPRFRDIIRIVKRHPEDFAYDANAEEAGQNARIRTAANWRPGEQLSCSLLEVRRERERERPVEVQVPNSAPARIAPKSITFAIPQEEDIVIAIPQSGPTTRPRVEAPKGAKAVSDADPMWQFQERERRLVREIVEFLDAPETNPNRGSVPSERVQNCIKAKFPGLYRSVVGAYYSNQWHRFIQTHGGPQGFELFLVQDGKRAVWRIRLERHTDFRQADETEKSEREQKEQHQLRCLRRYLDDHGEKCKVDEFMAEYEQLVPKEDMPKRGDFVRFVRRNVEFFDYDSKNFVISCAKAPQKPDPTDPPVVVINLPMLASEPWGHVVVGRAAVFLQRSGGRVFSFASREWCELHAVGPQPTVRQPSVVAVAPRGTTAATTVLVFGGWEEHSLAACSNKLFALDLQPPIKGARDWRGTWRTLQPRGEVPSPRSMHSAVLRGDLMYVLGGQDEDGPVAMDLYAYDIPGNTWSRLQTSGDAPGPRYGHTALLKGSEMCVFGGAEGVDRVHMLDLTGLQWRTERVAGSDGPPAEELIPAALVRATAHAFSGARGWALNFDAPSLAWRPHAPVKDGDAKCLCAVAEDQGTLFKFVMEQLLSPLHSLGLDRPLTSLSFLESAPDDDFRRPETSAPSFASPKRLLHV